MGISAPGCWSPGFVDLFSGASSVTWAQGSSSERQALCWFALWPFWVSRLRLMNHVRHCKTKTMSWLERVVMQAYIDRELVAWEFPAPVPGGMEEVQLMWTSCQHGAPTVTVQKYGYQEHWYRSKQLEFGTRLAVRAAPTWCRTSGWSNAVLPSLLILVAYISLLNIIIYRQTSTVLTPVLTIGNQ